MRWRLLAQVALDGIHRVEAIREGGELGCANWRQDSSVIPGPGNVSPGVIAEARPRPSRLVPAVYIWVITYVSHDGARWQVGFSPDRLIVGTPGSSASTPGVGSPAKGRPKCPQRDDPGPRNRAGVASSHRQSGIRLETPTPPQSPAIHAPEQLL